MAILALGTFSVAAHAEDRRDDHRGGRPAPHPVDHGRPGYGGGYDAPPPVVHGGPVYAPPPVVYSPGVSITCQVRASTYRLKFWQVVTWLLQA